MNAIMRHWDFMRAALADEKARAKGFLRSDETTFLPAALEIAETPVSPTARVTAWVALAGLAVTCLWITFGTIDVVASAQGKLIPADNVKLVQPAEPGTVRAILVRDGQAVHKGQPLVELDPTVSGAEAEQARSALQTAELDAARARAVLGALDGHGLAFVAPPGTPARVEQTQRQLANATLLGIQASIAGTTSDKKAAFAARAEAAGQAAKLTETLPLLDEQIAANESLLAMGFVSKLKVIEMRRQRLSTARDRDIALQTIQRMNAQMASTGSDGTRNRAEARARVLSDLAKAESDASLRREELIKSSRKSSLQRLLAPVNGTVAQLAVHTVGGVVESTKPIMVIVPSDGALVVEAKVLNKDMGYVAIGDMVAVKLEAFPFTRFGTIPGRIETVGSDAVEDEKLGLVYTVRVRLGRASVDRGDKTVPLTPGMAVTTDIRTGRRTILSYLVSPINEARLQAARER
jgi:hemolysin D